MNRRALLVLGLATAGITTAAQAQPAPPYPPVPQLREEVVPPSPGGRVIWEPGHWQWASNAYAWVPGRYAPIGRVHAHWIHGHWAQRGGAWRWVPAHWE
jgi:hypothetical protein